MFQEPFKLWVPRLSGPRVRKLRNDSDCLGGPGPAPLIAAPRMWILATNLALNEVASYLLPLNFPGDSKD